MTTPARLQTAREGQTLRALVQHGLVPAGARACPRVVAGQHCVGDSDYRCLCRRHYYVLDRARIWLDRGGHLVLTGEPDSADGTDLVDLITDMSALRLRTTVSGRSPWYPGETVLIVIRKEMAQL
jgi:hypothetical protein